MKPIIANLPEKSAALLGIKTKPIVLAPGQSIYDLSLEEILDRGIDWEATAKASLWIRNIGDME